MRNAFALVCPRNHSRNAISCGKPYGGSPEQFAVSYRAMAIVPSAEWNPTTAMQLPSLLVTQTLPSIGTMAESRSVPAYIVGIPLFFSLSLSLSPPLAER